MSKLIQADAPRLGREVLEAYCDLVWKRKFDPHAARPRIHLCDAVRDARCGGVACSAIRAVGTVVAKGSVVTNIVFCMNASVRRICGKPPQVRGGNRRLVGGMFVAPGPTYALCHHRRIMNAIVSAGLSRTGRERLHLGAAAANSFRVDGRIGLHARAWTQISRGSPLTLSLGEKVLLHCLALRHVWAGPPTAEPPARAPRSTIAAPVNMVRCKAGGQ